MCEHPECCIFFFVPFPHPSAGECERHGGSCQHTTKPSASREEKSEEQHYCYQHALQHDSSQEQPESGSALQVGLGSDTGRKLVFNQLMPSQL